MSFFLGKKIIVSVTGGIAAYKIPYLIRLLIKSGAEIKVIMTEAAKEFVAPVTLATLSKNPVLFALVKEDQSDWNNHVELGLWADLMIVAPATANTLAKMANGVCDNLLTATYLSAKCPVYIAPAMDLDMYIHPSTQENLKKIQANKNTIIPVNSGELASGLVGQGRLAEPEEIFEFIQKHYIEGLPLYGKTVLITAGPTYEPIDPVRFIGNHSSGKMGYELAKEASKRGAKVFLVSGPSNESVKGFPIKFIKIQTAEELHSTCTALFSKVDIAICTAAVADYRPKTTATQKIKKKTTEFVIELTKTKDTLASLGKLKTQQILVGFALETNNEVENAIGKLERKNLDFIVLNSMQDKEAGFQKNTNKITIINQNKELTEYAAKLKSEVAKDILNTIIV